MSLHPSEPPAGGSSPTGSPPATSPQPAGMPDQPTGHLGESLSPDDARETVARGDALAITNAVVRLLRAHSGRGPTRARTTIAPDLVVVHLRDCLTTGEKTVVGAGHAELAVQGRDILHEAIREESTAMVEEITGRHVVAYLSTQAADPDHALIAFVLDGPSA